MTSSSPLLSNRAFPFKDISNADTPAPLHSKRRLENDTAASGNRGNPVVDSESAAAAPRAQDALTAYVPGELPFFWECPNCNRLPLSKRSRNSVVFYGGQAPPTERDHPLIAPHFKSCLSQPMMKLRSSYSRSSVYCQDESESSEDEPSSSWDEDFENPCNFKKTANLHPVQQLGEHEDFDFLAIASSSSQVNNSKIVFPQQDRNKTAAIDILLASQLSICRYTMQHDCNKNKRSYELPEDFPGIQCQYCFPEQSNMEKTRNGRWFCRSSEQLSNTMSKIHHHLMSCPTCPKDIKQALSLAKAHEAQERKALEARLGQKASRSQYCVTLFQRIVKNFQV